MNPCYFIIDTTIFEEHFRCQNPGNIWQETMKFMGKHLQECHYKQLYQITGNLGIQLFISFYPTKYEILYIFCRNNSIEMTLFRRRSLNEKFEKPCYKKSLIYKKAFYNEWSKETIDMLLKNRPGIITHAPLQFSRHNYNVYNYFNCS